MIFEVVKGVISITTALSTGMIVGNVIRATTPTGLEKGTKIVIGVGSFFLGGMVGSKTAEYAEGYCETVKELATEYLDAKKQKKVKTKEPGFGKIIGFKKEER